MNTKERESVNALYLAFNQAVKVISILTGGNAHTIGQRLADQGAALIKAGATVEVYNNKTGEKCFIDDTDDLLRKIDDLNKRRIQAVSWLSTVDRADHATLQTCVKQARAVLEGKPSQPES